MRQTFMYKLYRTKHAKHLHQQISIGGVIHNHCIALHKRYYRLYKRHLSPVLLKAPHCQAQTTSQVCLVVCLGSQAIQDIVERIDKGYQRFFQNVKDRKAGKTTQRIGTPTFRKVRNAKSFTLKQAGWKLLGGNRLRLGTTVYKFAKSRDIAGTVKTVTIKRDALVVSYVDFSCLGGTETPERVTTGKRAGFDFGLRTYLTGNEGQTITAPQPFKRTPADCQGQQTALDETSRVA